METMDFKIPDSAINILSYHFPLSLSSGINGPPTKEKIIFKQYLLFMEGREVGDLSKTFNIFPTSGMKTLFFFPDCQVR